MCNTYGMKNTRTEIKAWLRKSDLRQYELAQAVGITPDQFSRLMSKKLMLVPSAPVRKMVARITGLGVEDASAWELAE